MKHIDEEQLTLYYYGESESPQPIASHLESCTTCRAEYERLHATLELLEKWQVPEPGENYEKHLWHSLQNRAVKPEKRRPWFFWMDLSPWFQIAGAFGLLAMAFFAGHFWHPERPEKLANAQPYQRRLLLASVEDHLERGEMFLTEYSHAAGDLDPAFQKNWARKLSNDNRLLRQAVASQGDRELGALLDSLEIVLLESVHQTTEPGDEELWNQCRELIFKIRVIQARLQKSYSPHAPPPSAIHI